MSLRRLAELMSRGIVLRRRLPRDLDRAPVYVSPDASLRYWLPGVERAAPELLQWARELVRPGDCVWDLGANVGVFATAAARRAAPDGTVVLVEPDPWLGSLLRRTIAAQAGAAAMPLVEAAVGAQQGTARLRIAARGRSANFVNGATGSSQAGGERQEIDVVLTTLDDLARRFPRPALIKIDVEGSELAALRGAERVLGELRPRILCEVGEPSAREVASLLRAGGYRLFDAALPPAARRPLDLPAWNTLAIPAELVEDRP